MMRKTIGLLALCAMIPPLAHAYLDPGNGSMMIQLLLAGLAGLIVSLKLLWRRMLAYFNRSKSRSGDDQKPSV